VTASCFSTSYGPRPVSLPRVRAGKLVAPAIVAALLAVLLAAPEQPQAQAEICQRHNGATACRVW